MRQIELIKGYPDNIEELESLVNAFIDRTQGQIIDITSSEEIANESGAKRPCLLYTIEYNNEVGDWADLFNYVTTNNIDRFNMYRAFFKLDNPLMADDTLAKLLKEYEHKGVTKSLAKVADIKYKEVKMEDEE